MDCFDSRLLALPSFHCEPVDCVLRLLTAGLLRRTEAAKARMVLLSCEVRGDSDLSCGSRESNSKTKAPDSQTGVVRRG